jgi:hypothetical protein
MVFAQLVARSTFGAVRIPATRIGRLDRPTTVAKRHRDNDDEEE